MAESTNGSAPLIHLEAVSKVFFTDEVETHALSGIDLGIRDGEYVAISGPSGCGKSTLLSILGLLDTPTEGLYRLNGESVENLKARQRARIRNRQIGFIFQAFNLIGDLTVFENVDLPLTYRGMPSAERKQRVEEALERGRDGTPDEALSVATVGRSATEGGSGQGARWRAIGAARRRTDRESRLEEW